MSDFFFKGTHASAEFHSDPYQRASIVILIPADLPKNAGDDRERVLFMEGHLHMFCLASRLDDFVWTNLSHVNTAADCAAMLWSTLVAIIMFVSYNGRLFGQCCRPPSPWLLRS